MALHHFFQCYMFRLTMIIIRRSLQNLTIQEEIFMQTYFQSTGNTDCTITIYLIFNDLFGSTYVGVHVCVCVCVCVCVYLYVCVYACMYACMNVCI